MYHQITDGKPIDIHAVSQKAFSAQLNWLHEQGYQSVSLKDLLNGRNKNKTKSPSRQFAITFDDGYLDCFTNALPILEEFGFQATIFLVVNQIGRVNNWDQGDGLVGAPLLDWNHIQEMITSGMSFGVHTSTHPDLTAISSKQAIIEIQDSRLKLEQQLQKPVLTFSYPYSRYNKEVMELVSQSGYELACTYIPHYVGGPGKSRYEMNRTGILATDSIEDFAAKVQAVFPRRLKMFLRTLRNR
jgi:peptidoglycan/xylan/chitin deacetylase (PgdA/CDA1 family)